MEEQPYSTMLVSDPEQTPQQRIQQQRANYADYVRKVKTAAANPSEPDKEMVKYEQLFRLTANPYVPAFILQGNYVVHGSSSNKQFTAYIYPDEWETIGDIYIKDNVGNRWTRLQLNQEYRIKMWNSFAPEGKYTPKKKIIWINDQEFVTIIGLAHGTIAKGGDLVKVTAATGEAEIIYPAYQKLSQEVIDFEQAEEELMLTITHIDANGLCQEKEEIAVPLSD